MTRRNATRPIREAQAFDVDLTPPRRLRAGIEAAMSTLSSSLFVNAEIHRAQALMAAILKGDEA